ncbi:MAG: membrane protein insertion efficiency factor YidD [Candidatus Muiribacteriota bacterium]|jgi:putative membrane protein insertion efficiency factor
MNKYLSNFIILLINIYKKLLSPYLGNCCRFYPSCSDYAIESINKYGFIKGILKSTLRILRCNNFFKGGYDPVN